MKGIKSDVNHKMIMNACRPKAYCVAVPPIALWAKDGSSSGYVGCTSEKAGGLNILKMTPAGSNIVEISPST